MSTSVKRGYSPDDERDFTGPALETRRKSILLDILNVLLGIRKEFKTNEMERFILNALSGEVLDRKSKKQIEALLQRTCVWVLEVVSAFAESLSSNVSIL